MASRADKQLLARSSPAGLAWYASDERWIPAEHLLMLSKRLVDVASGRCPRLMVFMPPRHGKSELISKYTPAWFLGNFPDKKVMLCSYSDTFAASWGRRARDVFSEHAPKLWGVHVNRETAGGGQWEVQGRDGIMVTAGVGGGITGKGADLMIIDDPVKNAQDASSQTIQELQIDWWKSTARTRLMPGAGVVLVMTRWHEADLAGRLIQDWMVEEADEWEIISLPGLAEEECSVSYPSAKSMRLGADPLGREVGEALWPRMFDEAALAKTRKSMGSRWFNAMYQQRPAAADGELFKRKHFRYYERDGEMVRIFKDHDGVASVQVFDPGYARAKFCTVDTAASEKTTADFTVVSTWLVTVDGDLLLWDRQREQFQGPEVKTLIRRVFFSQSPQMLLVEKTTVSMGIIEELVREGLPIVPITPDSDKVTRSLPMIARYEEHRVFHPMGLGFEWVKEEWEPELLAFPNGSNDDQVDTASYAGANLPLLGGAAAEDALRRSLGARSDVRGARGTLTGGLMDRDL